MSDYRVLYAEDDDDHAELVGLAIEECGAACQLDRVRNGEEALQYLRREGEFSGRPRPDLLLIDINMPRMNGIELAEAIARDEDLRTIPRVMLTSSNASHDKRRAMRHCVNSYLVKPTQFEDMITMFEVTLTYWSVWDRSLPDE